jgi:hypothetical protein
MTHTVKRLITELAAALPTEQAPAAVRPREWLKAMPMTAVGLVELYASTDLGRQPSPPNARLNTAAPSCKVTLALRLKKIMRRTS